MSANQMFGYIIGATYMIVGGLGFIVTGELSFTARVGNEFIIFDVNPLHNIVHIGVGALLFTAAAVSLSASRAMNTFLGLVFLALGILGFIFQTDNANILAVNGADNILHLVTAFIAVMIGLFADRQISQQSTVHPA